MQAPWGLYVHIPYCKSVCPYCDFNSYVQPKPPWEALGHALCREFITRRAAFGPGPVRSVFFGGGTPSLAPAGLIAQVLQAVADGPGLKPGAEVTLEANPGTVDTAAFLALKEAGVNRISLGWQSTHDRLLRVLGRGHSAQDSAAAYDAARTAGFTNISLDLIFAVPGQTAEDLAIDLTRVVALKPAHVSLYALTYHEGTPFYKRRARGQLRPADEDTEVAMMQQIDAALAPAGFEHYEVSNYAQPGRRAQHNSLYWQGGRYLGIGPGAHSFHHDRWQQGWRWESTRDPQDYMKAWSHPAPAGIPAPNDPTIAWQESVTARQMLTERMLCGLRQTDGVPLTEPICQAHAATVESATATALARGWGTVEQTVLKPTRLGMQHADALAELFF